MRRSPNKSYYHYFAQYFDEDGDPYDGKYYMTLQEIMNDYGVSRKTLHKKLNKPTAYFRNKRLNDVKFIRVKEPRFVMVRNPEINID